jgi:hypothetical protein
MDSGEMVDIAPDAQWVGWKPGDHLQEFPVGVLDIQVGIVFQFVGLDEVGHHIEHPESKKQKVRPILPFGIWKQQTPDIQESQRTKTEIKGLGKIRDGKNLYNISRIIKQLLKHGQGQKEQKQSLVKIWFHILSPAPYEKPGYKNSLKDPQENNQIKDRYKGVCNHYANVGISIRTCYGLRDFLPYEVFLVIR